jgi:hypothetical protein
MLIDPAAVALVISTVLFVIVRLVLNRFVDLNRFVWRRPLVDISLLVILYCLVILTLRPI